MTVYLVSLILFIIDIAAQNYFEYQLLFALLSLYCVCLFKYRNNLVLLFQMTLLMIESFIITNNVLFSIYPILVLTLISYSLYSIILPTATFIIYVFLMLYLSIQLFFVTSVHDFGQVWVTCTIQQICVNIVLVYLMLKLIQQKKQREGRLGNHF